MSILSCISCVCQLHVKWWEVIRSIVDPGWAFSGCCSKMIRLALSVVSIRATWKEKIKRGGRTWQLQKMKVVGLSRCHVTKINLMVMWIIGISASSENIVLMCYHCLTFGDRWNHQQVDERCAVAVTYQSDVIRITVECPDVLLHPVQGGHLVEQGVVARRIAVSSTQEPCPWQNRRSCVD